MILNLPFIFFLLLFLRLRCSSLPLPPHPQPRPLQLTSLVLPLKTQRVAPIPGNTLNKLPFRHNVSLTVSLSVGTPPQNISMVLDTGSELSWLNCNSSSSSSAARFFDLARSASYSPYPCDSPTCTSRTRDFPIPTSCDPARHCHATLSYADASSSEGTLASDTFYFGSNNLTGLAFGCMGSVYSTNAEEDAKSTGLMGMNRGSLSFISQMGFPKFSYCISSSDFSGLLLLGEVNLTSSPSIQLNYTPLIQISTPLPYFDRVAYTVRLEGIKVNDVLLPLPESILVPDHTGAGQTMVDSGAQFSFLLGPVYSVLKTEYTRQTEGTLRLLDDPNFVFQGAMDLCYRVPANQTGMPELPSVSLVFSGAEMRVPGDRVLYRVPDGGAGDPVHCMSFGNADLLGIEAFVIGHHHQQNVWMEFDLQNSRIGLASVRCDLAGERFGLLDNIHRNSR
ncbi:hypothetical protein MLD38_032632 [Melastoma candidum]|uniref:Uncharacterized protein n=1 Tax=Melastoma candidum TaxID=119954 RepID=A0ACB9M8H5_9MYRT|nr:hypothetical protein MLD38_032632 [Melastoma candidum]